MHHLLNSQTRRFVLFFLRSGLGLVLLLAALGGQGAQESVLGKTSEVVNRGQEIDQAQTKHQPDSIEVPGDWDESKVMKPSVLKDVSGYKMWYDGVNRFGNTRIGLAYSSDGTTWRKSLENPILSGGPQSWDIVGEEHGPFVMHDGGEYKMWYEGSNGAVRQLGFATSPDGIHWTKYAGNPVLKAGPEGYDQDAAGHGAILFEGGVYKLWYHAVGDQGILIAYATSADGITWTKHGPVFKPEAGGWDQNALWGPSVLKVNGMYWMWYAGDGLSDPISIGVATSPNGLEWTRVLEAPLDIGNNTFVGDPHVIQDGGIFKMWYQTWSQDYEGAAIYYAESEDGIHWTEFGGNPVIRSGSFRVLLPSVQK
jgi:predicted GH43/DUF377 family glycosyl hydrolase